MAANSSDQSDKMEVLDYVLQDFLEVKTGLGVKGTEAFKKFVFSLPLDGCVVASVEGFLLSDYLVVLDRRNPSTIDRLIFLNPENGSFRVKQLNSRRPIKGHPVGCPCPPAGRP